MIDGQPFLASEKLRAALEAVARTEYFPAGRKIFSRGDPLRGIFLVRSGKVRLSLAEPQQAGNAGPRSALGLPATIANTPYMLSASALDDVKLALVSREQLMKAMEEQPDLRLEVIQMLGIELQRAKHTILGKLAAANVRSRLWWKKSRLHRHVFHVASTEPPGLERARELLSELKAQYRRLPDVSRSVVREQLRFCAETCAA